ncbi:hypothetical protein C8034_v009694 [Colletotrichum sidae]|uniref:Transcription factor IIIC putative zinc-finger domain-containing protein n=1 Tax=Colletotrichum sidae TaxID=1347389 RepID=A0A4R8TLZ9_9PEZI|nr:hypothetical protein C8034_v009694 [Colletotrichum sidae]
MNQETIEAFARALSTFFYSHAELTNESKIPPLKSINLKSRPLTRRALAFSCDAELAVAADDSVHVFLPEFPSPEDPASLSSKPGANVDNNAAANPTLANAALAAAKEAQDGKKLRREQYYTYMIRIPTSRKPDPRMNASLFAAQGVPMQSHENENAEDAYSSFEGVGSSTVTGFGASLNQLIALEWSPAGVGRNLRPVLGLMLTNGALLVVGERVGGEDVDLGTRMRNFRDWRILWGVGANLPLPDAEAEDGEHLPHDKIRSFAWAKKIENGRSLLAYANDEEEIVLLSVQYYLPNDAGDGAEASSYVWNVQEVARFDGAGPHPPQKVTDLDYVPYKSVFSLRWSPWLLTEDTRTAVITYCARSYVGSRRVTIPRNWARGTSLEINLDETDVVGICVNLLTGAFVEYEDAVWDQDGSKVCRGVIATPFKALPFQVALNAPERESDEGHDTSVCGTTYPTDTTSTDSTNPITSLVIHAPDMTKRTKAPSYSLVRLSATSLNNNWFQQNAANTVLDELPKWAETISSTVKLSVPVSMLGRGGGAIAADDAESAASDDDDSDDDDDFDLPEDAGEQINPYRVRIMGMTESPAGAVSAVLVSQHSTQRPEKSVKTRVLFGGKELLAPTSGDAMDVDGAKSGRSERSPFWDRLSTEAKMWDWMYGAGADVPGTLGSEVELSVDNSTKERFAEVRKEQRCVFCETELEHQGRESVCRMGHTFAICAATGLSILAPGISRACGVCGRRCLVAWKVLEIARKHFGPDAKLEPSEEY